MNPVDELLAQLDVIEKGKPSFAVVLCQLRLLQAQNVLLQEVLQQLKRMEDKMKKPVEKPANGKMMKCKDCGKAYAGKSCPHCAKGKKAVVPKGQKGGWRDSDATAY